jgi:hypothetical protein
LTGLIVLTSGSILPHAAAGKQEALGLGAGAGAGPDVAEGNALAGVPETVEEDAESVVLVLKLGGELLPVEPAVAADAVGFDLADAGAGAGAFLHVGGPIMLGRRTFAMLCAFSA